MSIILNQVAHAHTLLITCSLYVFPVYHVYKHVLYDEPHHEQSEYWTDCVISWTINAKHVYSHLILET